MKKLSILYLLALSIFIACSNGSGGGGDNPTISGITASVSSVQFKKNSAITAITFTKDPATATGTFSVSPNLPAGLNFNMDSGEISGTPTAVTASKSYTITFTGSGSYAGQTATVDVTIEIGDLTFGVSASVTNVQFQKDSPITAINFTKDPADATGTFSVSPNLPAGLNFNVDSGEITGTPTAVTTSARYTVTLTGSGIYDGKSATVNITIEIINIPSRSDVYAALDSTGTGSLSFDFGGTTSSVSITGKTAAGAAVNPSGSSASGNNALASGATAFLSSLGNQGTITVKATLGGVAYTNTYTYYTVQNTKITADRVIVNNGLADFTLTGSNQEVSIIYVTNLYGSANVDKVVVTSQLRSNINGNAGNDIITGGAGNDSIRGNDGNDRLSGLGGLDDIYGHNGNDTLLGGDGTDELIGHSGADTLTGGAGADNFFYFATGQGGDTITDFATGSDEIHLFGFGRLILGNKGTNTTWSGTGTASANAVVFSASASALSGADTAAIQTAAAELFESTDADGNKMLLATGNSIVFVRQDDNDAVGADYDAQIFHIVNKTGTITAELLATLDDSDANTSVTIAYADFIELIS